MDNKESKLPNSVQELKYSDLIKDLIDWPVAILPWGAVEPHGDHLPYLTDMLLANSVASVSMYKAVNKEEINGGFMLLPPLYLGIHNLGQVDKPYCLNFSTTSQNAVLYDIVYSLNSQGIHKLVIINGHNGNDFKPIVRELSVAFPEIEIYVCDYLSVLGKLIEEKKDELKFKVPCVDDHAAFTETSLMLYLYSNKVEEDGRDVDFYKELYETKISKVGEGFMMWSPRNFNNYSYNNRIGMKIGASPEIGKTMFTMVTDQISEDLLKIYNNNAKII